MKKINLLSIVLGFIVLTLFISGFNETLIAGTIGIGSVGGMIMATAKLALVIPASLKRLDFETKSKAKGIAKEYSDEKSEISLIDFIEKEFGKQNPSWINDNYAYHGKSGRELIIEREKSKMPLAVEILATQYGIKLGIDKFSKVMALENGAGDILFPALLALTIERAQLQTGYLSQVIAGSLGQDSTQVRQIVIDDNLKDRRLSRVGKADALPKLKYSTSKLTEDMGKIGGILSYPTEVFAEMSINVHDTHIMELAEQMEVDQTSEAFRVMVAGDNRTNSSLASGTTSTLLETATTDVIVLADVAKLLFFGDPAYLGTEWKLASNGANLAKLSAAVLTANNSVMNAQFLKVMSNMIQWEQGVFASGGAASDLILKFNQKKAITHRYKNPGLRIISGEDENQQTWYSLVQHDLFQKGARANVVALDITHS